MSEAGRSNMLSYRGYSTFVRYDTASGRLYGKLEGVRAYVDYELDDRYGSVEEAFHEAVDDYLAYCENAGIVPEKPYSGKFNVRVTPTLHAAAAAKADREGTTLNNVVKEALAAYV